MSPIFQIDDPNWPGPFSADVQRQAATALEDGRVLFLPNLAFTLLDGESRFLRPDLVAGAKHVSYDPSTRGLAHCRCAPGEQPALAAMLARFSALSKVLVESVVPAYKLALNMGRTSLRAVEAEGRASAWRTDDTRLHVDSFPSTPVNGKRILRVFSNVNPEGRARFWRFGEPFAAVARRFAPAIRQPLPGSAFVRSVLQVTTGRRSLYDHYMLGLHDAMKADADYQRTCPQTAFAFPAQSTWIVFTDCLPHAVSSGQHQVEQTFYLPPEAMVQPDKAPIRVLEKQLGRSLLR